MSDDLSKAVTPQPATPGKPPGPQELWHAPAPGRKDTEPRSAPVSPKQGAEEQRRKTDEKLDQALKGTFPASDPFSIR